MAHHTYIYIVIKFWRLNNILFDNVAYLGIDEYYDGRQFFSKKALAGDQLCEISKRDGFIEAHPNLKLDH